MPPRISTNTAEFGGVQLAACSPPDRPACWPTSRRCRAGGWATPAGSSTGWRRPGSRGGRSSRSGRPTSTGRPTGRPRPSPGGPASCRPRGPGSPSPTRTPSGPAPAPAGSTTGPASSPDRGATGGRRCGTRSASTGSGACCGSTPPRPGVRLIGDVPIYVAPGSADHVAHPDLFRPGAVAGVPPDLFSATGQRWGNPLFDWPAHRRQRYAWWTARLRRTFDLVDLTRIDHFRAFAAYWAVPESCPTAVEGRWLRGPGRAVFDAATAALGAVARHRRGPRRHHRARAPAPRRPRLPGHGRRPVRLRRRHAQRAPPVPPPRAPGRLQRNARQRHRVGWWTGLAPVARDRVRSAARAAGVEVDDGRPWWTVVDLTLSSPARLAVVPLQDVLGLGSEARMNTPGTDTGNWSWRAAGRDLTPAVARRLHQTLDASNRLS